MSAQQRLAVAQFDTQAFALMSRMHVILRRESGRVTDIEYMRHNPTYCKHVLELAEQMDNEILSEICVRLREIFFGEGGLFMRPESKPLFAPRIAPASVQTAPPASSAAPQESGRPGEEGGEQAYVGRLR
jgi:hypothetical protein